MSLTIPALWPLLKGFLYFCKLFFRKRRIFESFIVYLIIPTFAIYLLYNRLVS
jgi:hypothetical protein